jgi:hypothetical protein
LVPVGPRPTDEQIDVLREITQRCGITLSSNYARRHAHTIAVLAVTGYITTRQFALSVEPFGRTWYPTSQGLALLEQVLWTR